MADLLAEVERLRAEVERFRGLAESKREQCQRDYKARVTAEAERDRLRAAMVEWDERQAEIFRLRAALADTPAHRFLWLDALQEYLPEDEPEDQLAAALGLVSVIRAEAG